MDREFTDDLYSQVTCSRSAALAQIHSSRLTRTLSSAAAIRSAHLGLNNYLGPRILTARLAQLLLKLTLLLKAEH